MSKVAVKVEVFEPALCCATGVCGEDVDQDLVTFSADMDFVRSLGGDVARYNLASEPLAFAENHTVKAFLEIAGSDGLPLVLVDGVTVMTGRYPDRAQLARWAGVAADGPASPAMLDITETGAGGCCGGADTTCC
ncbi:arsenite efflux transporter metallochaperone ArsD [Mycobacterium sp.]|uniref:arsenite efflux transporter metallochaperone ArsD n=1 Tax=Mycobacterium sp. TaxID=1785 RepID=UPI0012759F7E|nr:arsenite efflux transporter metallochaperone ArsD [Mycobacterium sp.]KAA8960177.1 MAG: arsenite efflux transporter metallochaperone ArsD [Mycobacterium sp.]